MVSYRICFQNQKALSYFQAFFFFFFFAPPLQRLLQVASRHCVLVASRAAPSSYWTAEFVQYSGDELRKWLCATAANNSDVIQNK